jgi:hypothetical protein
VVTTNFELAERNRPDLQDGDTVTFDDLSPAPPQMLLLPSQRRLHLAESPSTPAVSYTFSGVIGGTANPAIVKSGNRARPRSANTSVA